MIFWSLIISILINYGWLDIQLRTALSWTFAAECSCQASSCDPNSTWRLDRTSSQAARQERPWWGNPKLASCWNALREPGFAMAASLVVVLRSGLQHKSSQSSIEPVQGCLKRIGSLAFVCSWVGSVELTSDQLLHTTISVGISRSCPLLFSSSAALSSWASQLFDFLLQFLLLHLAELLERVPWTDC